MTMYLKCGVCNSSRIKNISKCIRQMCPIQSSTKKTGKITGTHTVVVGGIVTSEEQKPIPMRLHCEVCHALHIDTGEFVTKPHHTHACQSCGAVWRPAIGPTVGVQFLPGYKDKELFDLGGHKPSCPSAQMFVNPEPDKMYTCNCR